MNIIELRKRTIQLLEDTRKKAEKYYKERQQLDKYLRNDTKITEWEKYVLKLEKEIGDNKI